MKPTIFDLSKKISKEITLKVSCFLIVSSLLLGLVLSFIHVRSKTNAIIHAITPYLVQLVDTNDYFQLTKQLNSIVENGSISSYQLIDQDSAQSITSHGQWQHSFFPVFFANGHLVWVQRYPLAPGNSGKSLELWAMHPMVYGPFSVGLFLSLFVFLGIMILIRKSLARHAQLISDHILDFTNFLSSLANEKNELKYSSKFRESQKVIDDFVHVLQELTASRQKVALAEMARQVSHDIKSPIFSVKNLLATAQIDGELRSTLRKNIGRIEDIANALKLKNTIASRANLVFLDTAIDYILAEKRNQHGGTSIVFDRVKSSRGLFVKICPATLSSIISNIVNNAVEAQAKIINICCNFVQDRVQISIADNGVGIAKDIQGKIFLKEFSYGKENGSGLGLYSAKIELQKIAGDISFSSNPRQGSTFTISLAGCYPPSWYVSAIDIQPQQTVVILDDEDFIHKIWQQKLANKILSFKCYEQFKAWANAQSSFQDLLFFLDFEFINQNINGLEIIKQWGIKNAVLVTNRSDDPALLEFCEVEKIKLLPKELVEHTPVKVQEKYSAKAIFFDDDRNFLNTIKLLSQELGVASETCSTADEFREALKHCAKKTLCFIDSDLNGSKRGEDYAREAFAGGYGNIYLMTGSEREEFSHMPWIKDIVNKEFPYALLS